MKLKPGITLSLFTVVYFVYAISPVNTTFDSRWSIPTAMSIIKQGNAELSEYPELLEHNNYYCIETVEGKPYSLFPVWTYIFSVPAVFSFDRVVLPAVMEVPAVRSKLENYVKNTYGVGAEVTTENISPYLERLTASLFTAASAVFIYLAASLILRRKIAVGASLLYAFGTSAWSTASRALWMHGPALLLLSIAIYLLMLGEVKSSGVVKYTSIPLALGFMVRPSNGLFLALFAVFIFLRYRKQIIPFVLLTLPFLGIFVIYNLSVYNSVIPYYFKVTRLDGSDSFATAFFGNLISPGRGFFVYSPFLLFSLHGLWKGIRSETWRGLTVLCSTAVILHLIAISFFPHWWGGHCYGSRLMSDILPFTFFLLYLSISSLKRRIPLTGIFLLLSAVSILIHFSGGWRWNVYEWNTQPVNIDDNSYRLWDWSDPPFLR